MQNSKTLVTIGLLCGLTSYNAKAQLTLTPNGLGVYDSSLDATWTQDANLLGTLEGTYHSASYNNIVNAIISSNRGVIHDTPNAGDIHDTFNEINSGSPGNYTLSVLDFGSNGRVTWWGAQGFVHYLNSQKYAGSSQWALPTTPDNDTSINYNRINSQLGELYYNELNAKAISFDPNNGFPLHHGILNGIDSAGVSGTAGPFNNARTDDYWSGTEYARTPEYAWRFSAWNGYQDKAAKSVSLYAWAVSPGQLEHVSTVPVPGTAWLFGSGMLGLFRLSRRKPNKNVPFKIEILSAR